jgi:hypothetical protein
MSSQSLGRQIVPEDSRHKPVADVLLNRVRSEFLEMPGLRLTEAQGCRLWGIDATQCSALLGALLDAKFLHRTNDGVFMRFDHHLSPAKATFDRRSNKRTSAA